MGEEEENMTYKKPNISKQKQTHRNNRDAKINRQISFLSFIDATMSTYVKTGKPTNLSIF